ncbi:MAG TPA: hypothetical protein VK667_04690, partial [Ktedonobacteraceae bacterium]|nr:hypothetical protein [Ktedonobacteraceae bacterium]
MFIYINSHVSQLRGPSDGQRWDNRDTEKKGLEEESDTMDALCLDFLNSEFRDFRGRWVKDQLLEAGWLEQFLIRW